LKALSALLPALVGLAVLGAAATTGACIEDPPPATTCPPPEPPAPDCTAALASVTQPQGCELTVSAQCLRTSCECAATECAPDPAACWPHGECPPALTALAAAGTSCLRLDAATATTGCTCGCPRCVSECDGKAVPLSAFVPPGASAPVGFFRFALPKNLPARGRLGLYARIRGQLAPPGGGVLLAITKGEQPLNLSSATLNRTYSDTVIGVTDGPTWQTIDAAPDAVDVLVTSPARLAVEIDCIIPFVEPL
jgi:hypothetical protein